MRKIWPRAISRLQPRPAGSTSSWMARQGASALSWITEGEVTSRGMVIRPVLFRMISTSPVDLARLGAPEALDLAPIGLGQLVATRVLRTRAPARVVGAGQLVRSSGPNPELDARRRVGGGRVHGVGRVGQHHQGVH